MSTFSERLDQGCVVRCFDCKGPVRDVVFKHYCDIQIMSERHMPSYCYVCMISRNICKRCKEPFARLSSIPNNDAFI